MSLPLKVLVVDDSAFMRKMICEILGRDPELCVVGPARDGADALVKLETLQPDVITLDVEMPVLDGFGTLTEIMRRRPTPVVMLSSLTQRGAEATLRCLELGAVDFVGKPSGSISLDIEKVAADLVRAIKSAAKARVSSAPVAAVRQIPAPIRTSRESVPKARNSGVLVIGSSTGGPRALQALVPALPADLGVPVVIVQHMPAGFTASLAQRLDSISPLEVREAAEGDLLKAGRILVAPGGCHLEFDKNGTVHLTDAPPIHGVRPSVDVTLASLTPLYGARLTAVLLTGMGRDGARGLKTIHDLGGKTFAEDETTCTVYGMPKAAVELGGVGCLLPLPQIAPALIQLYS
ncbi:MAG: protein-glutamate methylesterase/protein-glutamine glutaminase [Janthinobacterium lividum]